MAGKLYNFNVSINSIVKLVRLSKSTIFKRLTDFSKTASGKLTTEEFKTVDLEEEADPPSFTNGRNRVQFAQQIDKKHDFVSSNILSQVVKTQERLEMLLNKRNNISEELKTTVSESKSFEYQKELPADYSLYKYELDENGEFKVPAVVIDDEDNTNENVKLEDIKTFASENLLLEEKINSYQELKSEKPANLDNSTGDIDLDGIDDEEIDRLLLTENEIKIKTELWLEENKEYLLKMKAKEEEIRQKEEEDLKNGVKKKKKCKRKRKDNRVADSAEEAIQTMLAERKFSTKINYDVLRGLKTEVPGQPNNVVKSEVLKGEEVVKVKFELPSTSIIDDGNAIVNEILPIYESGPLKRGNKRPSINLSAVHRDSKKPKVEAKVEKIEIEEQENGYEEEEADDKVEVVTASSLFARDIDEFDNYDDDTDAFY